MTITTHTLMATVTTVLADLPTFRSRDVAPITIWITGFLSLLNIGLAVFYRKNKPLEVISYYIACTIEAAIFVLALLTTFDVVTRLPLTLPPGLVINLGEIAIALAIGIGLFPAAYWHRVNVSELPKRIAEDGKAMKGKEGSVRVRSNAPGEWMN